MSRAAQPLSTVANDAPQWTLRYTAYARAHGATPAEMVARDCAETPTGPALSFIRWVGRSWDAWEAETSRPSRRSQPLTEQDHAAFDAWLLARGEA